MIEEFIPVFGKHTVKEALKTCPESVRMLYLTAEAEREIDRGVIGKHRIALKELNPKKLPKGVPPDAVHQGMIALIDPEGLIQSYETFIQRLTITNHTAFVLLGEVQDPHNVGAVIRSAAAFGIAGVLIPEHRQAQVNGTVIKASAGLAFSVPLIQIGNVNATIKDLKQRGFWIYGLDGKATTAVGEEKFEKPSVFILGNEGSGIREKTLEHCDIPLLIPMMKEVESLNASVAAGIVLYAWSVHHAPQVK